MTLTQAKPQFSVALVYFHGWKKIADVMERSQFFFLLLSSSNFTSPLYSSSSSASSQEDEDEEGTSWCAKLFHLGSVARNILHELPNRFFYRWNKASGYSRVKRGIKCEKVHQISFFFFLSAYEIKSTCPSSLQVQESGIEKFKICLVALKWTRVFMQRKRQSCMHREWESIAVTELDQGSRHGGEWDNVGTNAMTTMRISCRRPSPWGKMWPSVGSILPILMWASIDVFLQQSNRFMHVPGDPVFYSFANCQK